LNLPAHFFDFLDEVDDFLEPADFFAVLSEDLLAAAALFEIDEALVDAA
jgi:hypothetical protein